MCCGTYYIVLQHKYVVRQVREVNDEHPADRKFESSEQFGFAAADGMSPRNGKHHNPEGRVIERDLAAETPPFITETWIQASSTPAAQRTAEQQQALALSDALIEELMAADVIVLGVPMHNFSIPASLKAWIDLIMRAGKTFTYSDKGPKGLIPRGKRSW